MDEYGFAAALNAGLRMFESMSRRTGRTSRMVERVADGDRIVVTTENEARRVEGLLRVAGKTGVQVAVIEPASIPMSRIGTARGRTFYDHGWVLAYFEDAIRRAESDLEAFQRATSKAWPEKPKIDESAERIHHAWRG